MLAQTQLLTEAKPAFFTRKQYVREQRVSHDDYFAQFVTEETLRHVHNAFTIERLTRAFDEDHHLNSIPLKQWDAITTRPVDHTLGWTLRDSGPFHATIPFDREAAKAAHEYATRATLVCIAKRAARMLVERHLSQPVAKAA
ncbi:MAG: hypothetical protein ABWX92_05960 [Mycetocola sp.]